MNKANDLLASQAARAARALDHTARTEAETTPRPFRSDACGCIKPADAWGSGGWHHRWLSLDEIVARIGPTGNVEADRERARHYADVSIAYEPCPAYRATVERQIASGHRRRPSTLVDASSRRRGEASLFDDED